MHGLYCTTAGAKFTVQGICHLHFSSPLLFHSASLCVFICLYLLSHRVSLIIPRRSDSSGCSIRLNEQACKCMFLWRISTKLQPPLSLAGVNLDSFILVESDIQAADIPRADFTSGNVWLYLQSWNERFACGSRMSSAPE